MAEFSKQWCDLYSSEPGGIKPGFDLLEKFKEVKEGYSESLVCEGFGILGIANRKGKLYVRVSVSGDIPTWEPYKNVVR